MKNLFRFLPFALLGLTLAACNDDNSDGPDYEVRVLTFEDSDYKGTDNGGLGFDDWSSLIDDQQYNGPLLYPKEEDGWVYNWSDPNNTFLASQLTDNYLDRMFWGGGQAVSDYADTDLSHGDFMHQLAVYGTGGHSGKNFCVHNGHVEEGDTYSNRSSFYFADGIERVVTHMWVANTTYVVNAIVNGDGQSPAFGEGDYLKAIAIGRNAAGEETGRCEIHLAKDTDYLKEWTKWELASLGKVAWIEFDIQGTKRNAYGLTSPAYFAYDDVTVRFE